MNTTAVSLAIKRLNQMTEEIREYEPYKGCKISNQHFCEALESHFNTCIREAKRLKAKFGLEKQLINEWYIAAAKVVIERAEGVQEIAWAAQFAARHSNRISPPSIPSIGGCLAGAASLVLILLTGILLWLKA